MQEESLVLWTPYQHFCLLLPTPCSCLQLFWQVSFQGSCLQATVPLRVPPLLLGKPCLLPLPLSLPLACCSSLLLHVLLQGEMHL